MPQFSTTTKAANSVWKSPDGSREIFEVTLDYEGQAVKAKTYSKDIATVGWSGTVDTYEKPGRDGSQTFVKQPPKEGGSYGSQGGTKGAYQPKDEKAIQAMWAIGQSVQAHVGEPQLDVADLESVKAYAIELNSMVADVKGEDATDTSAPDKDVVIEDIPDGPVDLSEIDKLFPNSEKVEKKWPPQS